MAAAGRPSHYGGMRSATLTIGTRAKWGLALIGASCLWLLLSPTEAVWWLIDLAGAGALLLAALAVVVVPRSGAEHPARRFGLHSAFGRWAVGLAVLHAAAIPAIDGSIWHYATPAIPVEIAAGLLALLALIATWIMREPSLLHRLPVLAQAPHKALAILTALLALAHIALIPGLSWFVIAALVGGACLLLLPLLPVVAAIARPWRAAAGVAALAAVSFLSVGWIGEARMATLRSAAFDQRIFDHATHGDVTCTTCHHNFLDGSGQENCIACHKAASHDERTRIDRTFHAFCTACHAERRWAGEKAGPVQSCHACHAKHAVSTSLAK